MGTEVFELTETTWLSSEQTLLDCASFKYLSLHFLSLVASKLTFWSFKICFVMEKIMFELLLLWAIDVEPLRFPKKIHKQKKPNLAKIKTKK